MGQKVHPYGFRLVTIRKPRSHWFAEGEQYRRQLIEDLKIRRYIQSTQRNAGISNITMDRTANTITVTIESAKPGIMIGRGGRDVDRLRRHIEDMVDAKVRVNVEELAAPDLCAQLVAENIAWQIERRVSPRRAMGQAMERTMAAGGEGVRCQIAGRIGGAEIARREAMGPEGRVPLHTLRADIDFGRAEAKPGYGNIGVKVWIYRGEILPPKKTEDEDVWAELEAETAAAQEAEAVEGVETDVPGEEPGAETVAMVEGAGDSEPEPEPEVGLETAAMSSETPAVAPEEVAPEAEAVEEEAAEAEAEEEVAPEAEAVEEEAAEAEADEEVAPEAEAVEEGAAEAEAEEEAAPEAVAEVETETAPAAPPEVVAEELAADEPQEEDNDVDA